MIPIQVNVQSIKCHDANVAALIIAKKNSRTLFLKSFFFSASLDEYKNILLKIIIIKLAVNAVGSARSETQSTLVLLATKALVKPPKDIV